MAIIGVPSATSWLVGNGNDSRGNLRDVGSAYHVATQSHLPDVGALKVGDATHGFFHFTIAHQEGIAVWKIGQSGWVRTGRGEGRGIGHIGGLDQRRGKGGRCCGGSGGQREFDDLTRVLGGYVSLVSQE